MRFNASLKILILIAILANTVGMFFPALISTYTPYYGSIAKHMVLSHNWTDLVLSGHDWLDKPHLPFWLTALSFVIFGVNSFAYILPGFLFYLLGVYFTYKLASYWYDQKTGLLAALFTLTALHLMLSASDVRAEAYLIGEIMPACYFWLRYDKTTLPGVAKYRYLLFGACFTALALMTKGLFVLFTIISGIAVLWIYTGKWRNFISSKWIIALVLSLILIFPEIWVLYVQFDMHPEKVVFGHTHVSGIRWYFWDSQFGRFFNSGPIMTTNPQPFHYIYFVHTFLWAYLPWWPLFFFALTGFIRSMFRREKLEERQVYLFASFFATFVLFSLTKFQVDHYTNIIFPFASIICAAWLVKIANLNLPKAHIIYRIETGLSLFLLILIISLSKFVLVSYALIFIIILAFAVLSIIFISWKRNWLWQSIVFPSLTMVVLITFVMFANGISYAKYDAGYQIAMYLNKNVKTKVVGFDIDILSLDLYSNNPYQLTDSLDELNTLGKPFYLVTKVADLAGVKQQLNNVSVVKDFAGCRIETFLANVRNQAQLKQHLDHYVLLKVN